MMWPRQLAPQSKPDWRLEEPVTLGEVITHLLTHQQPVEARGRRESLALREVSPETLLPVAPV